MFKAQAMCEKHLMIKTLNGHFLSVLRGQIGLTKNFSNEDVLWQFKPTKEIGRFYIEHVKSGERLVDEVNGGYDSWSVEEEYTGCFAFISQGGLYRHFDYLLEHNADKSIAEIGLNYLKNKSNRKPRQLNNASSPKKLAEYYYWLIES
ncbi:hypothetical protein N7931_05090 [Catenovulum sp. 2E275]|uniref:hypothetical protein n=1 Tax=Catenovulum sp. 2E275 TaxID=2980497 RepID=UPI0021CFCCE6|nr:hypothetical protein [Catenovulum sp. 2E275]MCU4675003.1 hypothetical protein [Catenovulum sp. 2E275]